ncbi:MULTISPECIES: iron efflux ABC transporter ATP-binding subunit FetA [Providencia]|uniref:Iron ABC transporter ATP-binding protein FetA n=1 Tax=Providencia huaxiensis TaxID=2027290 RepID=A0A345LV34_9GAMM|nr:MULTISPECIES: iron ABC transporter ATP-binding protein FetA [Providencia]AXH61974.1 iron ABC transporter ATP-binding protein FetA [Providencia huaxiensis]MBN6363539.1 iron ABC transporter ATP-binding protein FetA [Providencia huaxiensis]MBQ0269689.1 iron ABC transporter ATP-binding protein FetA [Providencia huaxiensis]MBQ0534677.1 iron ABC transporter ATP-binding protein FetA [Providencia huaxiensis]MBQ0587999.1 iron ABC transporter ATP-binding protein FetA [Providencia huaxiensis]
MEESNLLLQLNNIGYSIEQKTILDNVQINLQAGDFKLITGPSGCGKSTLLKIVASLISPTQGTIKFQGKDITTILPETYRQQVSYCTQTPTLFGQTVYDNLVFPYQIRKLPFNKDKVISDLQLFSLHPSILEKGINELSGGEKQRVSLIRNLQFLPQVLLLDEITSALDEENKIKVNEFIHHLASDKKIGVLWVTHDQDEIAHTNEIITLPVHHTES